MTEPLYLFDTNILIYLVAGSGSDLRDRVEAISPGEAVTSTICVAEVAVGLQRATPQALSAIAEVYGVITPLPFDVRAAEYFGRMPYRRGRSDRLIAAHALALDVTLVTNNERDFADVAGLRVENWTI